MKEGIPPKIWNLIRASNYFKSQTLFTTGVFKDKRYFDVVAEYCKASPTDILGRYSITNRGPDDAVIHVLPTLWYRNIWSWGECDVSLYLLIALDIPGIKTYISVMPTRQAYAY